MEFKKSDVLPLLVVILWFAFISVVAYYCNN
jgi:hypothetical protein